MTQLHTAFSDERSYSDAATGRVEIKDEPDQRYLAIAERCAIENFSPGSAGEPIQPFPVPYRNYYTRLPVPHGNYWCVFPVPRGHSSIRRLSLISDALRCSIRVAARSLQKRSEATTARAQ